MLLHKSFSFEAAHFLPGHPFCGTCHGHRYEVSVTLDGKIGENGMVVDFHELSAVVDELKRDVLDHKLLNESLPVPPTAEMIAVFIFDYFVRALELAFVVTVEEVTLQETEHNAVTCTRDDWEQFRDELQRLVVV